MSRDLTLYTRLRERLWNEKIVPAESAYKKAFRDLVRVLISAKDFTDDQTILLFLQHFSEMYQYANLVQAYTQSFAVFFVSALGSELDAAQTETLFVRNVLENPNIHDDPASEFYYRLPEYLNSHPRIQSQLLHALFGQKHENRSPDLRILRQLQLLRVVLDSVSIDHDVVADGNAHRFSRASIVGYALDDFLRIAHEYFMQSSLAVNQKLVAAVKHKIDNQPSKSDEAEYVRLHRYALRAALSATDSDALALGRFVEETLKKTDPCTGQMIVSDKAESPPAEVVVDVSARRTHVVKQWQIVSKSRDGNNASYAALFAKGVLCLSGPRARYTLNLFQVKMQSQLRYARSPVVVAELQRRRSSGVNLAELPVSQTTPFFTRKRVLLGLGVLALTGVAVAVPYVVLGLAVLWVAVAAVSTLTASSTVAFFLGRKSSVSSAQVHPTPVRRLSHLSQSTVSTALSDAVAVPSPRKVVTPTTTPQKSLDSPTRPRARSTDSDLSLERSPVKTVRRLRPPFTPSHVLIRAALPKPLQLSDGCVSDESVSVFSPPSSQGTPVTPGKYFGNPVYTGGTPKQKSPLSPLHPRVQALREGSLSPRAGSDAVTPTALSTPPRRVCFA